MGVSTLPVSTVNFRAFDVSGGTLWLSMMMLTDDAAAQITKDNPLAVGGGRPVSQTATIANGAFLSGAIDLDRSTLSALIMPAAWTTAGLSFQISADNSTFVDFYDKTNNEITMSVAASRGYQLDPSNWLGIRYIKIRSGTSATSVNQGAARSIVLLSS
jgi:hypothetical protein